MSKARTKFTLRFRNPETHEILGLVADRYGVSMNQLAEDMLERELRAAALVLELDLSETRGCTASGCASTRSRMGTVARRGCGRTGPRSATRCRRS
jgi:hypothetical protein